MADVIEYEEGYDVGGTTSDDTNPPVTFRQDAQNLVDIVESQGLTYQDDIDAIKALDLTYCPKFAYCFDNDKLYEYDATSVAVDDDVDVLLPDSLVGRWLTARDFSTSVAVTQNYVDAQDLLVLGDAQAYTDARCESGAEVNIIETISVNSVNVAPDGSRNVDITVPENISELNNDDNYVADANYVHTDNNYDNAAVNKLAGIATGAQVNVIESVKVNGTALTITNKAVDITTTQGVQGDSAYAVAVAEGYVGSQTQWVASLQGADGTLWKYTAVALAMGSDITVGDLVAPFAVDDLVISTNNNIWGIIKSVAGADAIVTGLGQGGANGNDGAAIFLGTAVTGTGTEISVVVAGSKAGDYYKNTDTSFWYIATAADTWDYKGSDKGDQGIQGLQGIQGVPGANGAEGAPGAKGEDGADGANIFIGTAVTGIGSGISAHVIGSKDGDYYKNTATSNYYQATAADTWDYKGNDTAVLPQHTDWDTVSSLVDIDYLTAYDGSTNRMIKITWADIKTLLSS